MTFVGMGGSTSLCVREREDYVNLSFLNCEFYR